MKFEVLSIFEQILVLFQVPPRSLFFINCLFVFEAIRLQGSKTFPKFGARFLCNSFCVKV